MIYLGRVPHGFYEEQMKSYFTQFGDVTRLRLSRNKKVRYVCSQDQGCPLTFRTSDGTFKTLRVHRVRFCPSRRNRRGDDGQLPPHGSHPQIQSRAKIGGAPRAVDRGRPKVQKGAHGESLPRVAQQGSFEDMGDLFRVV